MRNLVNYIVIAAVAIILSGCVNDKLNGGNNNSLDYSNMELVTLGSISTTNASPQYEKESRATTTSTPMAIGKTFRLYAFPKGETNIDKLITTRTYTIQNVEGEPVLDANQDNLFLPVGEVDIFLVGPVQHDLNEEKRDENGNKLPPNIVDIATPYWVTPRFGVDLVSSKTPLTIKAGANQFQAEPLTHRMAQMEVVVKRPNDATYTDLNVAAISVINQTLTGNFEFNDTGGEVTPADEGTETLSPIIRNIIPNEEFRGTMYVIPRKLTQLRIGVFLTCKLPGSTAEVERRMESGIMTEALVAGQMNRFTTKPYLSDHLIFRLRLMPWDDISIDEMDVPSLDKVLFSYSGLDAPRMINGKMCVPDRSGNNCHGELVGDIRYNAEGKYYYAAANDSYIKVPDLGDVPVYTFEVTAANKRNARSKVASFRDNTSVTMDVFIPLADNHVWFYAGELPANKFSYTNNINDKAYMNNLAVYAFTRNSSHDLTIRRNGVVLANQKGESEHTLMNNNKLLIWSDKDKTEEALKMYAARMTTTVDNETIANNYRNDIANYVGVTVDKDPTKRDYIEDGLILDLRGTSNYSTSLVAGKYVWPDASIAKNHAVVISSSRPSYSSNSYTFNGGQYMQLLHTLGTLQDFTVEIVAKMGTVDNTILNFASNLKGGDNYREFSFHLPYNTIQCYSPYTTLNNRKQLKLSMSDNLSYSYADMKAKPNQWSLTRHNDGGKSFLEAWLNGGFEAASNINETRLLEMRYCFIGSNGPPASSTPQYFNSSLYAIRVYNRPLTDLERQHNYQTDKQKYNLVP